MTVPDFLVWHCAGCGAAADGKKKPCSCATNVGVRYGPNGKREETWWDDEGASDGWQPISTAPKSTSEPCADGHQVRGVYFLAYCPDESVTDPQGCMCVCWWEPHMHGVGKGGWQGEGDYELRPTHWMPLPAEAPTPGRGPRK